MSSQEWNVLVFDLVRCWWRWDPTEPATDAWIHVARGAPPGLQECSTRLGVSVNLVFFVVACVNTGHYNPTDVIVNLPISCAVPIVQQTFSGVHVLVARVVQLLQHVTNGFLPLLETRGCRVLHTLRGLEPLVGLLLLPFGRHGELNNDRTLVTIVIVTLFSCNCVLEHVIGSQLQVGE